MTAARCFIAIVSLVLIYVVSHAGQVAAPLVPTVWPASWSRFAKLVADSDEE
jgi:hypothetical protein